MQVTRCGRTRAWAGCCWQPPPTHGSWHSRRLVAQPSWRRGRLPTPGFLPEESQDRGAGWATVHGVAESRRRLSTAQKTGVTSASTPRAGSTCPQKHLGTDSGYCFQIRYKTNEPVWEENFTFFIHNPKRQELEVEVIYLHVYIDVFISPHHTARRELPPWTHQPDMLLLQVLAAGQEELVFNFQLLADCSWCLELQLAFVCWRHCQPCCACLLCSCSVDIQGTAACWLLPARALPSSLASLPARPRP